MVVAPASISRCEYQLSFAVDIETNPMQSITPFLLAGSTHPLARQRRRNVPLGIATRSWCARLVLFYRACFSQKDFWASFRSQADAAACATIHGDDAFCGGYAISGRVFGDKKLARALHCREVPGSHVQCARAKGNVTHEIMLADTLPNVFLCTENF